MSRGPRDAWRFIVPEVVQTSAMDCGPAALKCLLEGFGIHVSYGRLREACQTDVDGTSIDTLEEVAGQLGLVAEQIMLPVDHLLLREARCLPAIVVTRLPSGVTHFVVAWRRHGSFVQVMDPATGRRWPTCKRFLDETYVHTFPVDAVAWREWAGSDECLGALRNRLAAIGLSTTRAASALSTCAADPGWRSLAALDATARMLAAVVRSRGVTPGQQAARVFDVLLERAAGETAAASIINEAYWSVRPAAPAPDGAERLLLRGAVVVRVLGKRAALQARTAGSEPQPEIPPLSPPLSPELVAALEELPSRPGRDLWRLLRAEGKFAPTALLASLALASAGVLFEALLFRGIIDLGRDLGLASQRLVAFGALVAVVVALLLFEVPIAAALLRLGRRIEVRLRVAFQEKLPRLGDRYFRSRIQSDMAERSHALHALRHLPDLGGQLTRGLFQLFLTVAGIAWLDPRSAPLAFVTALVAVVVPLIAQPVLVERDMRFRTHAGALGRLVLDSLLGLIPLRTHAAERAVRREHEKLLVEWGRAGLHLQRAVVGVQGLQFLACFALAAWLLLDHLSRQGAGSVLLLVYWVLNLPFLGQDITVAARQYPEERNITLRLLELLNAPEESDMPSLDTTPLSTRSEAGGAALRFERAGIRAAGHTILADVDLEIEPGSHVAVVGSSGAGKSSLVGLLLGWHRAATGRVLVDGVPLAGEKLARLRQETAWVDPALQLWNRSFLDNLDYGAPAAARPPLASIIESAELRAVLEKLPDGLQTRLGEGGALVSGGEGQRVRLGRSLQRQGARLVILDEPFRGLDRERRRALLHRARQWWSRATLLCITHDVGETLGFDRVLVVEAGHIVEDGAPSALAQQKRSRYAALLQAETALRQGLWSDRTWRRIHIDAGHLSEPERSAT